MKSYDLMGGIVQLEMSEDTLTNNIPIYIREGRLEQAKASKNNLKSIKASLRILRLHQQ